MKLSENDYTLMSPFQSEQVLANSEGENIENVKNSKTLKECLTFEPCLGFFGDRGRWRGKL